MARVVTAGMGREFESDDCWFGATFSLLLCDWMSRKASNPVHIMYNFICFITLIATRTGVLLLLASDGRSAYQKQLNVSLLQQVSRSCHSLASSIDFISVSTFSVKNPFTFCTKPLSKGLRPSGYLNSKESHTHTQSERSRITREKERRPVVSTCLSP